jgi:hypothetical protein
MPTLGGLVLGMASLFCFAMVLYCYDWDNLNGAWILDDKGTITMNPVVLEQTPWEEVRHIITFSSLCCVFTFQWKGLGSRFLGP